MAQILQQLRDQRRDIDAAIRALEALDRSQPASTLTKLKAQRSGLTVVPVTVTTAEAAA